MASIRQEKISSVLQQELSFIFQKETKTLCLGSMVSVTKVNISSDLSVAKVYLSIFAADDKEEVLTDEEKVARNKAIIANIAWENSNKLRALEGHFRHRFSFFPSSKRGCSA